MELDRAFELAVISSWEEIVASDEACAIHVVYEKLPDLAVNSIEVWKIKNRGYEGLVCRYSISGSESGSEPSAPRLHFANSYRSQTLADNLDFIMRNQCQFSRPADSSSDGLVQIDVPSDEDRKIATAWSRSVRGSFADTSIKTSKGNASSQPEDLFSKKEEAVMSDRNKGTPTKEEVRRRAFELFSARGRADGKDLDDWVAAERELTEHTSSVTQKTKTAKAG